MKTAIDVLLKSKLSSSTENADAGATDQNRVVARDAAAPAAIASGAPGPQSSAAPAEIFEDVVQLANDASAAVEDGKPIDAAAKSAAGSDKATSQSNVSSRISSSISTQDVGKLLSAAARAARSSDDTPAPAAALNRDRSSSFLPIASVTTARLNTAQLGASFTVQPDTSLGLDSGEPMARDLATQIVQSIRMQWTAGAGAAQIQLEPSHLGEMTISLHVNQTGQVEVRLEAASPVVREWLQTNQHALKGALADQQLTLDRLEVAEPPESRDADRREGQQQSHHGRSHRRSTRDNTGDVFEVVA
jgi:flagellar hook-length control protein FliK